MKQVLYVQARDRGDFPEYSIPALQRGLSNIGMASIPTEPVSAITLAGKVLSRVALIRQIAALPQYAFLVPMMGPTERRFWPVSYLFEVVPYCYDCWPTEYARWEHIFRRNRVRLAFFSAQQSARTSRTESQRWKHAGFPRQSLFQTTLATSVYPNDVSTCSRWAEDSTSTTALSRPYCATQA